MGHKSLYHCTAFFATNKLDVIFPSDVTGVIVSKALRRKIQEELMEKKYTMWMQMLNFVLLSRLN